MTSLSLGDLALSFQARQANHRLKTDLQRLGTELTSGVTSDTRKATGGDMASLAGIERSLNTLESFRVATSEAALLTASVQSALGTVENSASDLGPALIRAGNSAHRSQMQAVATDARARFATAVSVLNTQVSGRTILGGTATAGPALADSETMLADLSAAVAGETTAAGIEAAVVAWFDTPGGGFETSAYLGASTPLAEFRIGQDERAEMGLTAGDREIRDLLKGFAMAALVSEGALSGSNTERAALIGAAGNRMLTGMASISETRAEIGTVEARIEEASVRNAAETSALEIARNDILAVDLYRAASELQAAQSQLEALYTVTARLSRLSLAEYLR